MPSRFRNQKGLSRSSRRLWRSLVLRVEELESRFLFSAGGLDNIFAAPDRGPGGRVTFPNPVGYDPAQIRHAYGFDQITFSNGAVVGDGHGQTIAIVDAYDDPNIFKDLDVFDKTFGLLSYGDSSSFLTKATPQGKPKANAGLAGEISLDVEWAHAIAPGAKILLVEARSASLSDLLSGVSYAGSQPGVVAVSMSWGGSEFNTESLFDSYFTSAGVTYVASAGDSPGAIWPATSPNVLAIGGTSLAGLNTAGDYSSATETAWSSSGGGTSSYESLPSYQSGVTGTSTRSTPDVSYDADPNWGIAVYDTVSYFGQTGWFQVGGTSAGTPQWAALVAIADQGLHLAGYSSLSGASQTLPDLYKMATTSSSTYFHDIGSVYSQVTGLGTPIANHIVQGLINLTTTGALLKVAPAKVTTTPAPASQAAAHIVTVTNPTGDTTNTDQPGSSTTNSSSTSTSTPTIAFFLGSPYPLLPAYYNSSTPVNLPPVSVPLDSTAVFVPLSYVSTGSNSRLAGGFGSTDDYRRGGLGPVLPAPEKPKPNASGSERPASMDSPERAPGDYPVVPPASPQKDNAPAIPDGKKDDRAPGDGFWDGNKGVDQAALITSEDWLTDSATESALLPGLVAFLSGSWGACWIDRDPNSKIRNPKRSC